MAEKSYNKEIANAIKTFLTEDDWSYNFNEERGMFMFELALKGIIRKINYYVSVEENSYSVYALSPISVDSDDEAKMSSMAQFVCMANYGMRNGNFELDMRDGEIRYKIYVDCTDTVPNLAIVKNSIYTIALTFSRYGMGIAGIIFGQMTAKEAIDKCE